MSARCQHEDSPSVKAQIEREESWILCEFPEPSMRYLPLRWYQSPPRPAAVPADTDTATVAERLPQPSTPQMQGYTAESGCRRAQCSTAPAMAKSPPSCK